MIGVSVATAASESAFFVELNLNAGGLRELFDHVFEGSFFDVNLYGLGQRFVDISLALVRVGRDAAAGGVGWSCFFVGGRRFADYDRA